MKHKTHHYQAVRASQGKMHFCQFIISHLPAVSKYMQFSIPSSQLTWQSTSQVFVSLSTWVSLKIHLSSGSDSTLDLGLLSLKPLAKLVSSTQSDELHIFWRSVLGSKAAKTLRNNGLETRQISKRPGYLDCISLKKKPFLLSI